MKLFSININGKEYDVLDTIELNNKSYIAYSDKDTIFINEYTIEGNKLNIIEISNEIFEEVKKAMNL